MSLQLTKSSLMPGYFSIWILVIVAAVITSVINSLPSAAADASKFQAGNIISDVVFTDSSSMNVSEIQSFLNSKVPSCDTNGTRPASEYGRPDLTHAEYAASRGWQAPPYTCLKSYKQDGKSAAQIIYNTSRTYSINPAVLIVLLQKEQTLVTDTWPLNSQYKYATGYCVPDNGPPPCSSSAYGFTNQVEYAARMFRAIMNDSPTWTTVYELGNNSIQWHPDAGCGSSTVNIQNRATQALYNYTPYRPNQAALNAGYGTGNSCSSYGNRNFYLYFTDWFGSTQRKNNIRLITCSDTPYLVERGIQKKRLIAEEAVSAWMFPSEYFVADDPGCSYPEYDIPLGYLMRSRNSDKLYFVDKGKAYWIDSQSKATAWEFGDISQNNFPQFDAKSITNNLQTGETLAISVTSDNPARTDIYLIDGGNRYKIQGTDTDDPRTLSLINGDGNVNEISVDALQTLSNGGTIGHTFQADGSWYFSDYPYLIKINDSKWDSFKSGVALSSNILSHYSSAKTSSDGVSTQAYYYHADGSASLKRTPDFAVARAWGVSNEPNITQLLGSKIKESASSIDNRYYLDGNIRLISCSGDPYLVERGIRTKRPITSGGIVAWGFSDKHFFSGDSGCSYPTYSIELDKLIRSRNTGKLYYIEDRTAYYVSSQDIADSHGFGDISSNTYPQFNPKSITDNLTLGGNLTPAP